MFETVLVASRGPVTRRVVATCQRLGIRAVSVHSEADAAARHATEADDSVLLGPAPPEQSYLDRRRVLEAARQCGASAVHPGAGALAQDPRFAAAVLAAGLAWIGAPPQVLERSASGLGVPPSGRRLAVHVLAGATVVPLSMLEHTAGPAGEPVLSTTIPDGEPVHPALLELAARSAGEAGWQGVGSVELHQGPEAGVRVVGLRPWLPVEHPASELRHGIDLVEQQLRLAGGQPATDQPAATSASAVLCLRVYAEDVGQGVRLERWRPPPDARVDSAAEEGDPVLPWYDPLLATLTVAGSSVADVRERAWAAVRHFEVDGLRTNLPRLSDALAAAVRSDHERRDPA